MEKIKKGIKIVVAVLFFAFSSAVPFVTDAANLYFSPQSGSYAVGSLLVVNIYVESKDQAMNAASGFISFPSDKLQVVSLSKDGSIFSLWVQDPSFLNSAGMVNFEGFVLNPGFTGASGKILSVTFRVKAAGMAPITFSSGLVLANDGNGTNILTGMGNASFQISIVRPKAPKIIIPSEAMVVEEFVIKTLEPPPITDFPKELPDEKVTIVVTPPVLSKIGSLANGFHAVLISLVTLIILLVLLLWYVWHKLSLMRKHLKK